MSAVASAPAASWWQRTGPVKRLVVVVGALVVGLNVLLAALDSAIGSDPGGPDGSSFATGDEGVAAWADLLAVRDVRVDRLRTPVADADLDPATTLVVVEPADRPTRGDLEAVAAHVAAGGRLVAVGPAAVPHLAVATGLDPGWDAAGPEAPSATAAASDALGGAVRLAADGVGRFTAVDGFEVLAGGGEGASVVRRGAVVAVADPTLLVNRRLADADNAALALGLAGEGPVAFAEAEHGYGAASGLSALPWRARLSAVGLLVAALVAMWSVGQRLGPAERPARTLAPARREYVDALAAGLTRARPDPSRPPRRTP